MSDQDINIQIKTAIDAADTATSLSDLKKSIRELQGLALQYGETNTDAFNQVIAAAGRARDRIIDVRQSVNSVSGEPIQNLSGSFNQVKSSLASLDFKQVTNGIKLFTSNLKNLNPGELADSFKQLSGTIVELGKTLLVNPIFLIGAAIGLIIAGIVELKDQGGLIGLVFEKIGKVIKAVTDAFFALTDAIGVTNHAGQQRFENQLKNLEKEKTAITDRYDHEIKIAQEAGKSSAVYEAQKTIALQKNAAEVVATYETLKTENGNLTKDQKEKYEESLVAFKAAEDAKLEYFNKVKEDLKKSEKDFQFQIQQEQINVMVEGANKIAAQQKLNLNKENDAAKQALEKRKEDFKGSIQDQLKYDFDFLTSKSTLTKESQELLDKGLKSIDEEYEKDGALRKAAASKSSLKAYEDDEIKRRQITLKGLQDTASLITSDQTKEYSEKKQLLLDNSDAQVAAYEQVYKEQRRLANGNSVELKRLEEEHTKSVGDYAEARNNILISANAAQLVDDIKTQEIKKALLEKQKELLKSQAAAEIANKQKAIEIILESDNFEIQKLQDKNSLKFGLEKELLDKIAANKKSSLDIDTQTQIKGLKDELKNKLITEQQYADAVTNINKDTANKTKQIDQQTSDAKKQINLKTIEAINGYAQSGIEGLSALADIADQSENQRLKKGEQASLETQKKQFNRHKALSLVGAILNTAEGISKAVAESPETGGLPGSAIATAIGGLQIAKIASQKFQGDSGSDSSSSSTSVTAPTFGAAQTLNTTTATNTRTGQFYGIGTVTPSSANKMQPQRVYVVESDITNAQSKVSVIQQRATLSGAVKI